jgi:hypothetical protein
VTEKKAEKYVVGRVVALDFQRHAKPLLFFRGTFLD